MNEIPSEAIRLLRDVDAYVVPSGDEVKLLAGNLVRITQALGGNYTVIMNGNMVQITAENADALGFEISEPDTNTPSGDLEQQIWDQLKTCYDPEIPVNVVDLGLIYETLIESDCVKITMTLTSPGCGMGPVLVEEIKDRVGEVPGVKSTDVEIVLDPPWSREKMTDAAKLELGIF